MAAIACATERVRIGPMVTPLARRRPWKLAREVASLDRLSQRPGHVRRRPRRRPRPGAVGASARSWTRCAGRRMLDEGLDVLRGPVVGRGGAPPRARRSPSTGCASARRRCSGRTRRSGSPGGGRTGRRCAGPPGTRATSRSRSTRPDQLAELVAAMPPTPPGFDVAAGRAGRRATPDPSRPPGRRGGSSPSTSSPSPPTRPEPSPEPAHRATGCS